MKVSLIVYKKNGINIIIPSEFFNINNDCIRLFWNKKSKLGKIADNTDSVMGKDLYFGIMVDGVIQKDYVYSFIEYCHNDNYDLCYHFTLNLEIPVSF